MITQTEENYLKTILNLSLETNSKISTNAIAEELGTSAASVSDMLKKLEEKKLILYKKYNGLYLSKKGKKFAINIMRKHRLWETFLVKNLNFNWSEVHEIAEQLEHIKSAELINRLEKYLNYPKFDPHGEPIPTKNGEILNSKTTPLNDISEGSHGKVMGVTTDEKSFLDYLTKLNISIGTKIQIKETINFDQSINIKIKNKKIHLSKDVAKHLLIKITE